MVWSVLLTSEVGTWVSVCVSHMSGCTSQVCECVSHMCFCVSFMPLYVSHMLPCVPLLSVRDKYFWKCTFVY